MTRQQFFILLATVWIAPHAGATYSRLVGVGFVALAVLFEVIA